MKTPVFYSRMSRTPKMLDESIERYLDTIKSWTLDNASTEVPMHNILYNLCYKLFYVQDAPKYEDSSPYTVADLCLPIKGVFQNGMIEFVHNMIQTAMNYTSPDEYKPLLKDCFSYELLCMLYRDPVAIYAALLYTFARMSADDILMTLASNYLKGRRHRPTLEWESMYNKYMERYECDE